MSNIHFYEVEQGSKEWLKLRDGLFTGSNVYRELLCNKPKQIFSDNYWASRGRDLEGQSIEIYERIKKCSVNHIGFVTNDKYPNAGYSPDGYTDILIETKSFAEVKHLSINNVEDVPPEVNAQVQLGMMILEKDETDLLLYNPDLKPKDAFKIIKIKADKKIQDNIKNKLQERDIERTTISV